MRAVVAAMAVIAMGCGARATSVAPPASTAPQLPVAFAAPPSGPEWIDYGPTRCSPEPPSTAAVDTAWVAPEGLDPELAQWLETNIVSTGRDPRGLEHRAVRVRRSPLGRLEETTGFVRHASATEVPLVLVEDDWWPAYSVGPVRPIDAACERALAALDEWSSRPPSSRTARPPPDAWDGCPRALAIVALAATGRGDLATRVAHFTAPYDLSLQLSRFARALAAHASGDDCLALRDLRILAAEADAAEARGGSPPWWEAQIALRSASEQVELVRTLLRDQERRAGERTSGLRAETVDGASSDRIADLVRALEDESLLEVSGRSARDALFALREAAIPALLDAVEHDTRSSRFIAGMRPWQLVVLSVAEIAYGIVDELLDVAPGSGDRAVRARARWAEIQAMSPEERERWWAERSRR